MAEVSKYKCKYCGRTFKSEGNCSKHEKEHEVNENPNPLYHVKFQLCLMRNDDPSVEWSLERLPTRLVDGKQIWTQEGVVEGPIDETVGQWYDGDKFERIYGSLHDHIARRLAGKKWRWDCVNVYKLIDRPLESSSVQEAFEEIRLALPTAQDVEQYRKTAMQYHDEMLAGHERSAKDFVKAIRGDGLRWMSSPDQRSIKGHVLLSRKALKSQYGFGSETFDDLNYKVDYRID